MKSFSRRKFLKIAGVTTGAAILGQGCQVTPAGVEPAWTELPPPGENYKLPACCSYEADYAYTVTRVPKRPAYGIMASNVGALIDKIDKIIEDPNLAIDDETVARKVRNCLIFSMDMLFDGDTHSARNGIAAVAEILTYYHGGYFTLATLEGVPADILKDIHFSKDNIDFWDLVVISNDKISPPIFMIPPVLPVNTLPPSTTGEGPQSIPESLRSQLSTPWPIGTPPKMIATPTPYAKNDIITNYVHANDNKLSRWLSVLQEIAGSFSLQGVFTEDWNITTAEMDSLCSSFAKISKDDRDRTISEEERASIGIADTQIVTYEDAAAIWFGGYLLGAFAFYFDLQNNDSAACENIVAAMYDINAQMKKLTLSLLKIIDEAAASAREEVVNNADHIWDVISRCGNDCSMAAMTDFVHSLTDWGGAKKYIIISACALGQIPTIIVAVTVPWLTVLAIAVAIESFLYCFISSMIGESAGKFAKDVSKCLLLGHQCPTEYSN
jgi:hypothetical protein